MGKFSFARLRSSAGPVSRAAVAAVAAMGAFAGGSGRADAALTATAAAAPSVAVADPFGFKAVAPVSSTLTPAIVTPLDTFSIALVGFNASTGNGIFLSATVSPTFGTTTAYTGAALGGQTLTVASSETVGVTTTTDTVTFSVPTNFVPTGTTFNASGGNNQTINSIELDLGEFNGGSNPINLVLPIASVTTSGSLLYSTNSTLAITPSATLGSGGTTIAAYSAIQAGTSDLSTFATRSFTLNFSYPTAVPEPTTVAGLLTAGAGLLARRARRTPR